MTTRLRIGVVGAGSIGCYVGGSIAAADSADVVFVGRARLRDEIAASGMKVKHLGADPIEVPRVRLRFETEIPALKECDTILCCVKSAQTEEVALALAAVLKPGAVVVSLQNGVRNPDILRAALPNRVIVPGIVSFNVVSRGDGLFHRTMDGPLMLERCPVPVTTALRAATLDVTVRDDLAPDQWTKLIVNLNNAVSALSGAPTRTLLMTPAYRRIIAAIIDESLRVLRAADIRTARLRGLPVGIMPTVLRLPTPLVRLVTSAQMKVDPEARSSMWEDLTRGRPTEVDYLNGEIVRVAAKHHTTAPLNARIVDLVHAAERAGPGSPNLDPAALWSSLR